MSELKKNDTFIQKVGDFFKRVKNQDLITLGGHNKINVLNSSQSKDELKLKQQMQVFRQYLQNKNWNLKHIEFFDEYRRMDATFPIINAALRLYSQEVCYFIDTEVVMLDNTIKTLKELIESKATNFWLWGYDNEQKKIVPVKCEKAISKGFKEILEIKLDDGTVLKCTPDHKHLLKDGSWVEAKDLKEGDSLRSIYTKINENGYLHLTDGEVLREYKQLKKCKNYWDLSYPIIVEKIKEALLNGIIKTNKDITKYIESLGYKGFSLNVFGRYVKKTGYAKTSEFIQKNRLSKFQKANHKVVSITFTKETVEVGDVVNAGNVHNFAVKCNEGMVIVHNCLSGDCVVSTPKGNLTIKELYESKNRLFYVQSFDPEYNRNTWGECYGVKNNGIKDIYEVTVIRNIDEDTAEYDTITEAKFKCTDNHLIMLPDKSFKKLSDLKLGDQIFAHYKYIDPECKCKKDHFVSTIITSIKHVGQEEVFDLINVAPFHNFTLKLTDSFYVYVHNCNKDADGDIFKIISDDKEVKASISECFYDNLKLDSRSYLYVRSMLKFGNLFGFLQTRRGVGVTDIVQLPPEAIRIMLLQNADRLDEFNYIWNGYGGGIEFDPWEIVHWKIIEDIEHEPYGQSILRSIVDTWRRVVLMREAMIIYRITRAPQRFLFKIDTTGLDPSAAILHAEAMKKSLHKKPLVNPITGEIDAKFTTAPVHKDTIIPLSDGRKLTIEELSKEYDSGKDNYVYSISDETHNSLYGKVVWCGKNYTADKLVKVILYNNTYVITAPEHPFILKDGSRLRADELKDDMQLMPFSIVQKKTCDHCITHEYIFNNRLNSFENLRVLSTDTPKDDVNLLFYSGGLLGKTKIKTIELLFNQETDVYCMTVEGLNGEQDRHNFALYTMNEDGTCAGDGIYIQNSVLEDFYMPTYEGDTSDVRILEGASNLDQVEDYKIIKDDLFAGLLIPKSYLSFEEDLCCHPDTKISMLDGSVKTIEQLAEDYKNGIINYVYSSDEKGNIKPGKITWAGATKEVDELYEVELDNGEKDLFTGNHPFMLRDGSYKRVDQLSEGESLMPLYTKVSSKVNSKLDGYLKVWHNDKRAWQYMHQVVGLERNPDCYKQNSHGRKVLHHIDFNKRNNEYAPYNHKVKSIKKIKLDAPIFVYDITVDKYHNFALASGIFVHNCVRQDTVVLTNEGKLSIKQLSDDFEKNPQKKVYSLSCTEFGLITNGKINWCKQTKKVEQLYRIHLSTSRYHDVTDNHPFLLDTLVYKRADELKIGDLIKNIYDKEISVTDIEIINLESPEYVYDLGVDKYHNFALESGIFVHNSNKAALSQEDLRFNNAVKQYQSYYIEGMLHVALVHLYMNGYSKDELESFELQMNGSSTLAEKAKNELLEQRINLANSALSQTIDGISLYSYTRVLKEILKFSDEEIAQTFKDQMIESKLIWSLKQLKDEGFYEEPDPDKKKAKMKGLEDQLDVFKDLKFESVADKMPGIESVLTKKLDKEIERLSKPTKKKASKKLIESVITLHESKIGNNIKKTYGDLGMKGE